MLNSIVAMLGNGAGGGGGAYESIASNTLGADAASVTFSGIPSTYASLQLRMNVKRSGTGGASVVYVRLNNDSSAIYTMHRIKGDGTTASAYGNTGNTESFGDGIAASTTNANIAGVSIIDIHDYASTTKNKTIRNFNGLDLNGSGQVTLTSNLWESTAAISSLVISIPSYNILAGTTISLYGIKGA